MVEKLPFSKKTVIPGFAKTVTAGLAGATKTLTIIALLASCNANEKKSADRPSSTSGRQSTRRTASGRGAQARAVTARSVRANHHAVRSLLRESVRAELWQDGLFVDLGSRDQHKYTSAIGATGGWKTNKKENGVTFAPIGLRAALTFTPVESGIRALHLRGRSPQKGQVISLFVDGRKVGGRKMQKHWTIHTFTFKKPLLPKRHVISFKLLRRAAEGAPAELDWAWFSTRTEPPTPATRPQAKVANYDFGKPRRGLRADGRRRYSFYLEIPQKSALVFDYGAKRPTEFTVQLTVDGGHGTKTLFQKKTTAATWQEAKVDLSAAAGKLARLDFISKESAQAAASKASAQPAAWGEPEIVRPGPRFRVPPVTPVNRAQNLIFIVIDTARKDAYKPFAKKSRTKAPVMARLARKATWFAAAYANSPWTKPSTATLLSGLYASTHGAEKFRSVLPKEVTLLSEHLDKLGFETGAFLANAFISDAFGFNKGWHHFINYARQDKPTEAIHLYRDALAWVKKQKKHKRFFLYMQTMDPHVPYAVPPQYLKPYYDKKYTGKLGDAVTGDDTKDFNAGRIRLTADDKRYTRALYAGEITYHDHYLGRFIEALKKAGRLENTLVVITNDHGEELFERGELGHGHSLYDEQIASPLMLYYPKLLPQNKRIDTPIALVDLPATICELLSVAPLKGMEGQSMRSVIYGVQPPEANYVISELSKHPRTVRLKRKGVAVRVGGYKLIVGGKKTRLFNLPRDPAEKHDLAASHPITRRTCELYLGEGLAIPSKYHRLTGVVPKKKFSPGKAKIDPKLRRQLQALAYTN